MSDDQEQITFFAKTDARGVEVPFGIKAKDRTRHVYVIGKTGMGKSTLLENMAIQDIKNGNGLAFIDPHGQTAETLLDYIPEERKGDVLYFAPFDTDYPVSFNVMEDVGPDKRHLVVSGLMSVFKKIWVDAWSARMEYILSNTLLALLEYPDATLLGVNRMLSDKHYRLKVIDNITDPAVKSFWVDEFLKYNERYMQEAGDAIKNKIGQFTSNPLIRNIIGQSHSSFDIREIMDQKKILIMNLSKGLVGESNANLLGSMLTTRIYLAAMSRADLNPEQMKKTPNFYFYVDEFQSFANATFADILSEARKYKLNLTIAHQYIEQMEEEVRNAVFGNVGTIISFRVGPFDAEVLESIFTPKFLAPDIVNLGFAQIYLTLMIDGIGSQPFSATTMPPIKPPDTSCKEMVKGNSRKLFAHPRSSVEALINAWHNAKDEAPSKKGGGNKSSGNSGGSYNGGGNSNSNTDSNGNGGAKWNGGGGSSGAGKGGGGGNYNNGGNNRTENNTRSPQNQNRERTSHQSGARNENTAPRQREERSERKPEQTEESKKRKEYSSKNEKSVDDLRAVLKKLSSEDTKQSSQQKRTESNQGRPERANGANDKFEQKSVQKSAESKSADSSSLKDALAQALNGLQETTKNNASAKTRPEPGKVIRPQQPQQQQQSKSQSEKINASESELKSAPNTDDPLSPKKLERMMRVTGNDKTPLK